MNVLTHTATPEASAPGPARPPRRSLRARLFPGEARAWLAALITAIVCALPLASFILKPREILASSNGVRGISIITVVPPHTPFCMPQTSVPSDAAALRLTVGPQGKPRPALRGTFTTDDGARIAATAPASRVNGIAPVDFPLPAAARGQVGTFCFTQDSADLQVIGAWGAPNLQGPVTQGGKAIEARASQATTHASPGTWVGALPQIARSAGRFSPWPFPTLVAWLALLAIPVSIYWTLRLVINARNTPARRLVAGLMLCAVAQAGAWAVTTVPFDGPDESEHFQYVETIARRGTAPDSSPQSKRPPYSFAQAGLLRAVSHPARIGGGDGKAIFTAADRERYERESADTHPRTDNTGGYSITDSPYGPLYYASVVPFYAAGSAIGGEIGGLAVARWLSVLLFAVVVGATFGIAREFAPRRREIPALAAGLVVLQPMVGFMGGVVNNDMGINALTALCALGVIRALRRGPSQRELIGVGIAAGCLPIVKGTGLSLLPVLLLGLALVAWRWRSRRALTDLALATGAMFAVVTAWALLAPGLGRSLTSVPANFAPITTQLKQPGLILATLWQVVFPPVHGMVDHFAYSPLQAIFGIEAFGAFGWTIYQITPRLADVILLIVALVMVAAAASLVRRRRTLGAWWPELAFLIALVVVVIAGVEIVFASPGLRTIPAEQGRYFFPAAAAVAVMAASALGAFPARWGPRLAAVAIVAMATLSIVGRFVYLGGVYT